jgi:phosphoribosyl 1,2-cyclic phosphodiesterase
VTFAFLASSSSANCAVVTDGNGRFVLVDAGMGIKETLKKLRGFGWRHPQYRHGRPEAILLTHRHQDHSRSAVELSKYWHCPIYCSQETADACPGAAGYRILSSTEPQRFPIYDPISKVRPSFDGCAVPVNHVPGSLAFRFNRIDEETVVSLGAEAAAIVSDCGSVSEELTGELKHCRLLAIDADYSETMHESSTYDEELKRRIASDSGHLSVEQAARFAASLPNLKQAVLLHLSEENNDPVLARAVFSSVCPGVQTHIAGGPHTLEVSL